MLKNYLEKTYGYNEPIFIREISLEGVNNNALRQYFKRMVQSGELEHFDTGIYYLPKASPLLRKSYLDPIKVIIRKYIKNDLDTFGYFTGATFANQLGLTTQMPAVLEIVSNREATNGRTLYIGGQNIRLKRPVLSITKENADLLQFFDALTQMEKYSERTTEEGIKLLKQYLKTKSFTQSQLIQTASVMTGTAAKKLIEWGMIYEFAS